MRGKNGDATRMATAAALEALTPRVVAPASPAADHPAHCPRCGGSVIRAWDEDGAPDDHCLPCGHRVRALLPHQAEALRREMDDRERTVVGGRRNGPRRTGMLL